MNRKILFYFLMATAFGLVLTAAFEIRALDRAVAAREAHHALLATNAARFVESMLHGQWKHFERDLRGARLAGEAPARHEPMLEGAIIAIVGPDGKALECLAGSREDLPAARLEPVVGEAIRRPGVLTGTDLFRGADGRPRVLLAKAPAGGGRAGAVICAPPLDGPWFEPIFGHLAAARHCRLQVLDSSGSALFSSRQNEAYTSVVRADRFVPRTHVSGPAVLQGHGCHVQPAGNSVREQEVLAIAPIGVTGWYAAVREARAEMYGPVREIALTSGAVILTIIAAFAGFFVLLWRQVLRGQRWVVLSGHRQRRRSLGRDLPSSPGAPATSPGGSSLCSTAWRAPRCSTAPSS
ncbi:MAG: hypothetical protein HY815_22185 [Candidatus Riflebacteria bacterium]|nr:hypothetical protein [Candidatus Riflebacteria bacterium]